MYGNVKSQNRKNLNCRHGQLQTLNVQTDTPDLIIPLMIPLIIRGMFCLLVAISHSLLAHYLMDNSFFAIPVYAHPDGQLNSCDSCLRPSYLIRATPKDSLC